MSTTSENTYSKSTVFVVLTLAAKKEKKCTNNNPGFKTETIVENEILGL